jgi:predicted TPR repeat methyltransferase
MHFNGGIKFYFLLKIIRFFLCLFFSISRYADPDFAVDPRSRSYHAYREWQRLSALKGAESIPMRDSSIRRDEDK